MVNNIYSVITCNTRAYEKYIMITSFFFMQINSTVYMRTLLADSLPEFIYWTLAGIFMTIQSDMAKLDIQNAYADSFRVYNLQKSRSITRARYFSW